MITCSATLLDNEYGTLQSQLLKRHDEAEELRRNLDIVTHKVRWPRVLPAIILH
jgi:hypothetical protein